MGMKCFQECPINNKLYSTATLAIKNNMQQNLDMAYNSHILRTDSHILPELNKTP